MFGFTSAWGQWSQALPSRVGASAGSGVERTKEENVVASALLSQDRHQQQMIAHGSLDMLEDRQYIDSNVYATCLMQLFPGR